MSLRKRRKLAYKKLWPDPGSIAGTAQMPADKRIIEITLYLSRKLPYRFSMQVIPKLTLQDFTYVREPELGQTYQNGPYLILVGTKTYSVSYQGQTFTWGLESILEAVEAVEAFDIQRRKAQGIFAAARAARRAQ